MKEYASDNTSQALPETLNVGNVLDEANAYSNNSCGKAKEVLPTHRQVKNVCESALY